MVLNKEVVLDYNKEDLGFDTYSTWRRLKKEKKVTLNILPLFVQNKGEM